MTRSPMSERNQGMILANTWPEHVFLPELFPQSVQILRSVWSLRFPAVPGNAAGFQQASDMRQGFRPRRGWQPNSTGAKTRVSFHSQRADIWERGPGQARALAKGWLSFPICGALAVSTEKYPWSERSERGATGRKETHGCWSWMGTRQTRGKTSIFKKVRHSKSTLLFSSAHVVEGFEATRPEQTIEFVILTSHLQPAASVETSPSSVMTRFRFQYRLGHRNLRRAPSRHPFCHPRVFHVQCARFPLISGLPLSGPPPHRTRWTNPWDDSPPGSVSSRSCWKPYTHLYPGNSKHNYCSFYKITLSWFSDRASRTCFQFGENPICLTRNAFRDSELQKCTAA